LRLKLPSIVLPTKLSITNKETERTPQRRSLTAVSMVSVMLGMHSIVVILCFLILVDSATTHLRGILDPKTIETKEGARRATVHAPSEGDACHVQPGVEFLSQYREDVIIYNNFFADKCGGTVVEMGGFTGMRLSNSWFFQYGLRWRALLVEAMPHNFRKMVQNRPDAINIFGAMCMGTSTTFQTGTNRATGGIAQDMSDLHKTRWTDESTSLVEVPCMLLSDVLRSNGIDHVDLFFLDVEGGELTVLQTFDWTVPIDMFVVEMDRTNVQKDEAIRVMLRSRGYITPFSMYEECKKMQEKCSVNELFVLETVWNQKHIAVESHETSLSSHVVQA
jgi:FkbM family methyltransferase